MDFLEKFNPYSSYFLFLKYHFLVNVTPMSNAISGISLIFCPVFD